MSFVTITKTRAIIIVEAVLFFCLVTFGISGSSISNIKGWAPTSISMNETLLIGRPRESGLTNTLSIHYLLSASIRIRKAKTLE